MTFFVNPTEEVYEGMVIGENSRADDMDVNITKEKKLTNMRSANADSFESMTPSRQLSLEECLEFAREDECVEVTPDHVRIRKVELDAQARQRAYARLKRRTRSVPAALHSLEALPPSDGPVTSVEVAGPSATVPVGPGLRWTRDLRPPLPVPGPARPPGARLPGAPHRGVIADRLAELGGIEVTSGVGGTGVGASCRTATARSSGSAPTWTASPCRSAPAAVRERATRP